MYFIQTQNLGILFIAIFIFIFHTYCDLFVEFVMCSLVVVAVVVFVGDILLYSCVCVFEYASMFLSFCIIVCLSKLFYGLSNTKYMNSRSAVTIILRKKSPESVCDFFV